MKFEDKTCFLIILVFLTLLIKYSLPAKVAPEVINTSIFLFLNSCMDVN